MVMKIETDMRGGMRKGEGRGRGRGLFCCKVRGHALPFLRGFAPTRKIDRKGTTKSSPKEGCERLEENCDKTNEISDINHLKMGALRDIVRIEIDRLIDRLIDR
jgi:hypothetical protein